MIITQIAAENRSNFFEGYVMLGLGTIVNAAAIVAGSLILITNKTIDKKSSHNPYTQDYAQFFV